MHARKKVCWVVASPLTIRFFLMGQISALARIYDLTVVTHTNDPEFLQGLGVSVRVIPVAIERNVSLRRDLWALLRLMAIFRREKFDLVHTLSPKTGLLGMVAAWLLRVPVRVHVFQGEVWATREGLWRFFLRTMDKWMARCATHLLVVSRSEDAFLVDQGVVPPGRLKMLANGSICGVDLDRFKPDIATREEVRRQHGIAQSDKVILYVGRLTRDKGLLDLADAFTALAPQHPAAHLLVVGPDEEGMREKMQTRCAAVSSFLHFSDYTPNPERAMAASDILCLPSYREGFGLVLIEAAAVGIATVGSRIYGISDAVQDKVTGLLFHAGDVADLTEKIRSLLDDPQLARNLGEAGKRRARRDFGRELVLAELLKFYQGVLAR